MAQQPVARCETRGTPETTEQAGRRRMREVLSTMLRWTLCLALMCGIFVWQWHLMQGMDADTVGTGTTCALKGDAGYDLDGKCLAAAWDKDAARWRRLVRYATAHDTTGIKSMLSRGDAALVTVGTRVLVNGADTWSDRVTIRVLDGPQAGQEFDVTGRALQAIPQDQPS